MDKGIYIWFYEKKEFLDSDEFLDINISFDDKKIKDIIFNIGLINLSTDNSIINSIKLLKVPKGCPFNLDNSRENYFNEFIISYDNFKIGLKEETYICVDKKNKEVILFFNERDIRKFIYFSIRGHYHSHIYDYEMPVNIIETKENNKIKYKGNIVFWGNNKGKPCYIP